MTPYYDDGRGIQIFLADCRDVLPTLAAESVDLVLTDPPYSARTHAKQWIGHALTTDGDRRCSTAFTELGFDSLSDDLQQAVAEAFARLCPRWSLAFCDVEGIGGWRSSFECSGLEYIRSLIWDKVDSAPQFTGDRPAQAAEAIVCAHPRGKKRWNGGGRRNVFTYAVNAERGAKPHPTTKPLPLMRELVALFSDPGDLVLDPFAGSGTTGRACKDLGRRCIQIEREEKYAEIAARRLEQEVMAL